MSELKSSKLTKTASSVTYSNRDDDSRKLTINADFSFGEKGEITSIDGGNVSDKNGLTVATFSRNAAMPGINFRFHTDDVAKMQEVIAEVNNFIMEVSKEGGEV